MNRALRVLAAVVVVVAGAAAAEPGGADRARDLRERADGLHAEAERLSAQSHAALLELYAVEAQLARSRERLAALEARVAAVRDERRLAARRLHGARRTLAAAQRSLAQRVRALYQRDEIDAFEVVLGAESFEDALTTLDHVSRLAEQDRLVARQAHAARARFAHVARMLAVRERRLARLRDAARAASASLERARAERAATVAALERRAELTRVAVADLRSQARAAEERSTELAPPASATPSVAAVPANAATDPGRQLTVLATAYALPGTTATGIPVGPGVIAVDPSVIPLGTRLTVPGYGDGVAADTGGAIVGARIDVWVATEAEAQAWGMRTVTVTIHDG